MLPTLVIKHQSQVSPSLAQTIKIWPTLLGALLLIGCASGYQSSGQTGGYSETWSAPDSVRVIFQGNDHTTPERAQDFAMLRAAELTLQHGFGWFRVVNEENSGQKTTVTTTSQANTQVTVDYANTDVRAPAAIPQPPAQTYVSFHPKTGLLVQCLKEKPATGSAFDAAAIQQSLRQKYNIH
jgi:hypothetical protein